MLKMPNTLVTLKRLFVLFCVCLFLWLLLSKGTDQKSDKKYKARHNYSQMYKDKQNRPKIVSEENDKVPFILRKPSAIKREDLKPKLVYRGTNEEIDPDDIGLVKTAEDKVIRDEGYKKFAYNSLVSKRLGFFRDIPDTRHKMCLNRTFPTDLPSASVIICFYNEEFDTLMRTIYSVIRRSPPNLIKEVILVNDNSDDAETVKKVEVELKSRSEFDKVHLLTTHDRLGLIRARIFGAKKSVGDVLVFLDSHVEANKEWLEPLLARVQDNSANVVTPVIDTINADNFVYKSSPLVRGGFNWGLNFKWESLPKGTLDHVEDFGQPILSPTMAGGLFAMDRKYFFDLGEYDPGLEIWGGENLEISFRIWMCGGRLEIIPCSRVGHVFRKRRPYTSTNSAGVDTQTRNSLRVGLVWLDEYIEHFYNTTKGVKDLHPGDVTERIQLRQRLGCKSFKWYHENIYPELLLPGQVKSEENESRKKALNMKIERAQKFERWDQRTRNYTDNFQVKHLPSGLCLEPLEGVESKGSSLRIANCFRNKKQSWYSTDKNEWLVARLLCMDSSKGEIRLMKCHEMGGQQEWHVKQSGGTPGVSIYNPSAGQCLDVRENVAKLAICAPDTAVWKISQL